MINVREQLDLEADIYARTEERLKQWGLACRRNTEALGLPTISNFAETAAHVRAEERRQKQQRKKLLRAARKAWKEGDPPIDAKLVAEELGFVEKDKTAKGKATRLGEKPDAELNGISASIDKIVALLPGWAEKCILRSYLYGQADRFAALDLRMPTGEYMQRRRAAVLLVAERLNTRYSGIARKSAYR